VAPDHPEDRDWSPFIAYNDLNTSLRLDALNGLGIQETDREVLGVLTKSHFVIPGVTRFECTQCGECCRYARKTAELTYEPCPFLTDDNLCSKHDKRYSVCKWFPFWLYNSPKHGPLLTIKPYCPGYGQGPLVDYRENVARLQALSREVSVRNDGAFVIHEVLHIPDRRDWMFPSRENIDALMRHIRGAPSAPPAPSTTARAAEVAHAHQCTSGLIGTAQSPLLTVNDEGFVTDLNAAACDLMGRRSDQLVGQPLSTFFVNPERVVSCLNACFARGKETASPHRLKLSGGATLPVLIDGMTFRDRSDGLVHSVLLCVHPISPAAYSEFNQSRTYARGLLEASVDALMVIDRDGAITDVNEAVALLTGIPRETLLGSAFSALFIDPAEAGKVVERTFASGIVRNFVLHIPGDGDEQIPLSLNATIYIDAEGVVQGIFVAARDIRERIKMIRELEEAKYYARGLIECCLDLMVTIDREGVITDANRAASVMTGYERGSIVGMLFKSLFDDGRRAEAGVEQTFREGEVRNYGMNLRTATQELVPVSFNATFYRDSSGAVQGVFAIARSN
jgi:PAS domain S-box-containing protein